MMKEIGNRGRLGIVLLAVALGLGVAPQARAALTEISTSDTPGSDRAVIFSPFGAGSPNDRAAMAYVKAKASQHGYSVTEYVDATEAADDNPGGATAANFLKLSGSGIVYIVSHGGTDRPATVEVEINRLLVESYATAMARGLAMGLYFAPTVGLGGVTPGMFAVGELEACDRFKDHNGTPIFGICITELGVTNHFTDNDSIVHVSACYSFNFVEEFNAREYFGYSASSNCPIGRADTELLWGRMDGEKADGVRRSARTAYEGGGFSAIFKYKQRKFSEPTVLSPAVRGFGGITPGVMFKSYDDFVMLFDSYMDTSVDPSTVLTVSGCGATLRMEWLQVGDDEGRSSLIEATVGSLTAGVATLTIHADRAVSRRAHIKLDGNQTPAGLDHVGPNGDDYVFTLRCQP